MIVLACCAERRKDEMGEALRAPKSSTRDIAAGLFLVSFSDFYSITDPD
jgi:hypothetical protein